jgi:hypothetical protein
MNPMGKNVMVFVVPILLLLIGSLVGCASDGALPPSGTATDGASVESQDAAKKKTRRPKLTLDDGKRGKASPALKNPEMASPPTGGSTGPSIPD